MTQTIKYDKHVKNLIDELSKTRHVSHRSYKKKSVTFHHNGGVHVSHEAILNIWKTRPASAHFDVDFLGDLAQYVKEDEYAWAVGNTEGNEETISIELTNSTGAPHWEISDDTFNSGARLAGWLFAFEIKEAPSKKNVFPHQHWSATGCPGPFVMKHFDHLLDEVQKWYHHFHDEARRESVGKNPDHVEKKELNNVQKIQEAVGVKTDGEWGSATDEAVLKFRKLHLKK